MASKWSLEKSERFNLPWEAIVGYQIPLFDEALRDGWGWIDLLGLSVAAEPVVIELKLGANREPPLRPLLEAASYAVVLQKSWRDVLRSELVNLLDGENALKFAQDPPEQLQRVHIVLAAPEDYWRHWSKERCKFSRVLPQYAQLVTEFNECNYQTSFVVLQLDHRGNLLDAQAHKHFPFWDRPPE